MCSEHHERKGTEPPNAGTASASETGLWKLKFNTFYSYKWHAGLYRFWKFWEEATAILPVLLSLSVVGNAIDKIDGIDYEDNDHYCERNSQKSRKMMYPQYPIEV